MQAVLWVVFAGTLALASYVGQRRNGGRDVQLGEPASFGELMVRLPKGWDRELKTAGGRRTLIAQEHDEEGRPTRQVWITQERQAGGRKGPAFYLETTFQLRDGRSEPFVLVGNRGVIIASRGIRHRGNDEEDPELDEEVDSSGLYACAVLKDGLTLTVQVRGDGAFGPSNLRLIRLVADNVRLADVVAGAPAATK